MGESNTEQEGRGLVREHKMSTVDDPTGEYAFLSKLIQHLDRHLIFPLLEHQLVSEDISQQRYDDLKLAIFNLLKNTNMIDYVGKFYKSWPNSKKNPHTSRTS